MRYKSRFTFQATKLFSFPAALTFDNKVYKINLLAYRVRTQMNTSISKANQSQGMLLFTLNLQKQRFAIGTLKVREIVPFLPTTQIPYSHQHVVGTVSIRGLTVPVIDMAAAIGFRPIAPEEYNNTYLVVTDCLRTVVAFMVRDIDKIIECDWKSIEPAPDSAGRNVFVYWRHSI